MKQALIKVSGKVQGVFFRAHAKEQALKFGLTGYVKNLPDGTVEALVQGEEAAINNFIEWCKKGSPSAQVEKVAASWGHPAENYDSFQTF